MTSIDLNVIKRTPVYLTFEQNFLSPHSEVP